MAAPEQEKTGHGPPRLLPRALALLLLLALADLWANRHFDVGLDHPGVLAPLGAALTAAAGFMDKLGAGEEARAWLKRLWVVCGALLSPIAMAALWAMAVIIFATVSSLVITEDSTANSIRVAPVGGGLVLSEARGNGSRRFVVTTTPFSKRYTVKADGFLPATFDVPPLVGQTVAVGRDLRPEPSLLFRPSLAALTFLQDGSFSLYVKRGNEREQIVGPVKKVPAAFFLVRARPVPSDWMMRWRFELESRGAHDKQIACALLQWNKPTAVVSSIPLSPGMTLIAEVRSRADQVVASREWVIGTDDVADVPLQDALGEVRDDLCGQ